MSQTDFIGIYQEDTKALSQQLRVTESFDVVNRELESPGGKLSFYFVDGFVKDEVMEKIMEFLLKAPPENFSGEIQKAMNRLIPYVEAAAEPKIPAVVTAVLSGQIAMLAEGLKGAILIDARTYPARGPEEPEDDRVLRGARDGFTETLIFNTALIRRRIRDPFLTVQHFSVGRRSKTDVALCYIDGSADPKLVRSLADRLKSLRVDSLTMGQESLAEGLLHGKWYNPFPKVRYTERPDAAAACLLEGRILLLVDNSPAAAILPTCLLDFAQETDDYCFPPLTGTYLRLVRISIFFLTLFFTPLWYPGAGTKFCSYTASALHYRICCGWVKTRFPKYAKYAERLLFSCCCSHFRRLCCENRLVCSRGYPLYGFCCHC